MRTTRMMTPGINYFQPMKINTSFKNIKVNQNHFNARISDDQHENNKI